MRGSVQFACLLVALCWHGDASSPGGWDAKRLAWVSSTPSILWTGAGHFGGKRAPQGGGFASSPLKPPIRMMLRRHLGERLPAGGVRGACMCAESGGKRGSGRVPGDSKDKAVGRRAKGVMSLKEEQRSVMARMDEELDRRATAMPINQIGDEVDLGFAASEQGAAVKQGKGVKARGSKKGTRSGRKGLDIDPLEEYVNQLLLSVPDEAPVFDEVEVVAVVDKAEAGATKTYETYVDEVLGKLKPPVVEEGGGGGGPAGEEAVAKVGEGKDAVATVELSGKSKGGGAKKWGAVVSAREENQLKLRLKNDFAALDKNGDGKVTASDLKQRLMTKGGGSLMWSKNDVKDLVEQLDSNRDGVVSEWEYVEVMSNAVEDRLRREFCLLDRDGKGMVTLQDLEAWLLGDAGWKEDEVMGLMDKLDLNHDGGVTIEEYVAAMSRQGPSAPGAAGAGAIVETEVGVRGDKRRLNAYEKKARWEEEMAARGVAPSKGRSGEEEKDVEREEEEEYEEELAIEVEMQRQEGTFASELFSLREEEARIILEPKRRELAEALVGYGASEGDATVASKLQTSFGDEWKGMLASLVGEVRMGGAGLCNMLTRDRTLLMLRPERVVRLVVFLKKEVGMDNKSLRYILGRRPSLVSQPVYGGDGEGISKVVSNLNELGITAKQLRVLVTKTPGILSTPPNNVRKVAEELMGAGLEKGDVASVIRRAPWVLIYDAKTEVQPVLECLRSIGVRDIRNAVKAYPDVLGLCPDEQILRVCGVLLELGIEAYSIAKMIEMCPGLLGVPVDEHLLPLIDYLEGELEVQLSDVGDMLRAYPGTMLLSLDRDIRPKEQFLRDVGLRNVGRVIAMAPQILTFDVATQLLPKMRFLDKVGLTSYDMANFPQLFSYPLDRVIRPRLLFLVYLRIPTISKPLKYVITPTDADFCNITLDGVSTDKYASFTAALPPMEMPEVPRQHRAALGGQVAFTRQENSNAALRVKGDARLAGYKALKADVGKGGAAVPKPQGREFFDPESQSWVYEGPSKERGQGGGEAGRRRADGGEAML